MEFSLGNVKLGTRAGEAPAATPTEETPFRIAVMGDFSGKGTRKGAEPAKISAARPVAVDRDNIESLLAKLNTELRLESDDGGEIVLHFKEIDDFRPDRIFAQVPAFDQLRSTRKKLSNPATFAAAAAALRDWAKPAAAPAPAPTPAAPPAPSEPGVPAMDLLDAVLGEPAARRSQEAPPGPAGGPDLSAFLRKAVSGQIVREDPRQAELIEVVDRATSNLMPFCTTQLSSDGIALEGTLFLARRLDTDTQLKLFVIDVSRAELAADLMGAADLSTTGAYRLIVEQTVGTPGAPPWAVLVGNYTFGPTLADVELLARLSMLAAKAGAPFLAAACPAVVGAKSFATADPEQWQPLEGEDSQAWELLRSMPQASYLGLALPRFLLRLPYGKTPIPSMPSPLRSCRKAAHTKATSGATRPSWSRCCWARLQPPRLVDAPGHDPGHREPADARLRRRRRPGDEAVRRGVADARAIDRIAGAPHAAAVRAGARQRPARHVPLAGGAGWIARG